MIILFHSNHAQYPGIRHFFSERAGVRCLPIFRDVHTIFRDIQACLPTIVGIEHKYFADGLEVKLSHRFPKLQVCALSALPTQEELRLMIDMGIVYGAKTLSTSEEKTSDEVQKRMLLTPRELEVIQLMCNGYSHQMICAALSISYETTRTHIQNIYMKLGVSRLTEAVAKAFRSGLVQ